MLLDALTLDEGTTLDCDICIVGGGAAGIAIAREMIGTPLRVLLLESGGLEPEDDIQALYEGQILGNPLAALDVSRLRYLGGSTNHWEGYCRPLEALDFRARAWVPGSGWPITRDELTPYYHRARPVLELHDDDYTLAHWAKELAPYMSGPLGQGALMPAVFQISTPTRLGEAYRSELERAANVQLWLHANLVGIDAGEHGRHVERLEVACLGGKRLAVRPARVVLATGGLENARLLLLPTRASANGTGNEHDQVGRHFMEHPVFEAGQVALTGRSEDYRAPASQLVDASLALRPETQEREQLLAFNCQMHAARSSRREPEGYVALRSIARSLRRGQWPDQLGRDLMTVVTDLDGAATDLWYRFFGEIETIKLNIHPEVAPNPDSRVRLIGERDALGLPRIAVDWRLSELDRHSIRRGLEIMGEEFGRLGLGRMKLEEWVLDEDFSVPGNGGFHHTGTTRMADDPRSGVVDRECRVHGIDNLFVAGSSVFATIGFANPTLTIVALALRLADHLKGLAASG